MSAIREIDSGFCEEGGVPCRARAARARARPKVKPVLSIGPHGRSRRSPVNRSVEWANQIAILAANRKASVIDLGRVVYAARQSLGYGEWAELWRSERIPFRKRQGDKL